MSKRTHRADPSPHGKRYIFRLKQGLICISSFSLLNSGIAIAQAQSDQEITPIDPASQSAIEVAPAISAPNPAFVKTTPASSETPLSASSDAITTAPVEATESYIDSTPYSLGATDREKPVVTARPTRNPSIAPDSVNTRYSMSVDAGSVDFSNANPAGIYPGSTTVSGTNYYRKLPYPTKPFNSISLIFPLSIPAPITSVFGWRIHPISGMLRFHSGTDIGAPLGTPVLAAYAGQVAIADFLGGYGLSVSIEHQNGSKDTLYAHLSEIFVKPGQWVKQGDVIGRVGSTGTATGPNLHFELRQSTSDGWAVTDPSIQMEDALVELVKVLQISKSPSQAWSKNQTRLINRIDSVKLISKPGFPFELLLTPKSWVALNPNTQLKYALAQLLKALQPAQSSSNLTTKD